MLFENIKPLKSWKIAGLISPELVRQSDLIFVGPFDLLCSALVSCIHSLSSFHLFTSKLILH